MKKKPPRYNIFYNTIINNEHDNKFNPKMPAGLQEQTTTKL